MDLSHNYGGFADVGMGIGMIIIGLASVIIGEALFGTKTIARTTFAVIGGAIIYRIVVTLALRVDFFRDGRHEVDHSVYRHRCVSHTENSPNSTREETSFRKTSRIKSRARGGECKLLELKQIHKYLMKEQSMKKVL